MNKNETINFIFAMPKTYRERGDISMADLLDEAGGQSAIGTISEAELVDALSGKPEVVDSWLQMSEDNRSIPAWFIRPGKAGATWEIGYYPDGESTYFDNAVEACVCYIHHYLKQLIGITR